MLLDLAKADVNDIQDIEITTFLKTDKLSYVFRTLIEKGYHSAPVTDQFNTYVGMITLANILEAAIDVFGKDVFRPIKGSQSYINEKQQWSNKQVQDVMLKSPTLDENQSLLTAIELLDRNSSGGPLHEMAVINRSQNVVGIVTHMSIIQYLYENIDSYPFLQNTSIRDIRPYNFVRTFPETARTIEAFKMMVAENISGVGVVNDDNELTDVISITDLKGIDPDSLTFRWLWNTIPYFKDQIRDNDVSTPTSPVAISKDDAPSFTDVLNLMAEKEVHRVFLVNSSTDLQVLDVISCTDMIAYILDLRYPPVVP